MYRVDDDVVQELRELVNRPAWQGEPTVLLYAHPDRHEDAETWWRETVGEGPSVGLRNAIVGLPKERLTTAGRRRELRVEAEDADLALVESEYVDKWRPVLETKDVPVAVLEVAA